MSSKSEGVVRKFEIELSDDFSNPNILKKIPTDGSKPLE
jgi:hypothetical protein